MLLTIIAFIFVIGILITVHEVGHFIAAKLSGIKVEEFSIGFPPRIFSFKKNETHYTIGALPFGGYVQMLGENEAATGKGNIYKSTPSTDPRAYNNASPGKRFIVSVAGVLMNFLLAWLLLIIGFSAGMTPIATPSDQIPGGIPVKSQIFIVEVQKDSPASSAGLQPGDELVKGTSATETVDFKSPNDVSNFTKKNLDKEVKFSIKRQSEISDKTIKISANKEAPLGVGIQDQAVVRVPFYKAPYVALREIYAISAVMISFLGSFFSQLFEAGKISDQVGGPVAIFNLSGAAARAGWMALLQFITMLSINLGLINILPFPALDGSRALFILLEKIFGKKVLKENVENMVHTIGFVLLIGLILAITYKDIVRLIHK